MSIEEEQVRHVARLARLALDDTTVQRLTGELSTILELVDRMNERETTGVAPMANPFDAAQRLREDEVTEGDEREKLQSGAPATERGLYLVPRVVE